MPSLKWLDKDNAWFMNNRDVLLGNYAAHRFTWSVLATMPEHADHVTGGNPQMIETIARAGIATGADGLFIETHPDPVHAKSDGANMLNLVLLEPLLERLVQIRQVVNKW